MTPFTRHVGVAASLPLDNVDTDVIIPIQPLLTTPRGRLGQKAFLPLRFDAEGEENPEFVLNRPEFRAASILIVGDNFGCGSSREPAVHALLGLGLRVVAAVGFGDIFRGNCVKNGLLPIVLPKERIKELQWRAETAAGREPFEVDLMGQTITAPGGAVIEFDIDPAQRQVLLSGLDEIAETLARSDRIAAYQARDRQMRSWIWAPMAAR